MTCNFCITKGDDALRFILIELEENDTHLTIDKLITTCGQVTHIYNNPVFPFLEGYTAEETLLFEIINTVYCGVVLSNGEFKTLKGSQISFRACPKVVDYTKEGNND